MSPQKGSGYHLGVVKRLLLRVVIYFTPHLSGKKV
jgi:hypothetical protein